MCKYGYQEGLLFLATLALIAVSIMPAVMYIHAIN